MNTVAKATADQPKRPIVVSLIALLALAYAVYSLVDAIVTLRDGDDDRIVDVVLGIVLAVAAFAVAVGSLRMRAWAWIAFMALGIVALTGQLLRYAFFDDTNYLRLAISTFIVLALTPRDVQVAFGVKPPPHVEYTRSPRNPLDRD
jgi:hypothetical protein